MRAVVASVVAVVKSVAIPVRPERGPKGRVEGLMLGMTTGTGTARAVASVLALVLCAGANEAVAQPAALVEGTAPAAPRHAAWVAYPSIDGHAGAEVGIERGVAPRTGVVLAASVRQTAASDFDAVRFGVAAEYRKYWRGRARWSRIDGLDRTGWFYGARVDFATSRLSMDERHIGSTLIAGARAELGYRLTPWRGLMITGLTGLGGAIERDAAGRLPTQRKTVLGFGLDIGWMF